MVRLRGLSELGQGRWEYRRRVPASAKAALGKSEWKRVVTARSDADLLRQHARVEAEFDREVKAATTPKPPPTPRAAWQAALRDADGLASGVLGVDDPYDARALVAESLVSRGDADPVLVQALMEPGRKLPAPTVEDARRVYVKERLGGGEAVEHRGAVVRLDRVMRRAAEAGIAATTPLTDITREDARNLRDHMLSQVKKETDGQKVSPASVKRELNVLRAMLAYGARELGVRDFENQFDRLPIEGLSSANAARVPSAREKVDPLPQRHVEGMRAKLTGDLRLIWRILTETGCRLGEVTGLRVEDVVLDGDTPHILIRWHEERRLKNTSSIRSVPLTGDALAAAREAVELAEGATHLFPRYARPRGSDAASAALMKHLRGLTTDKRHKVHSLRHGMKDRMRKAGVDKGAQDVVLGHASGNIGETYGGDEGLLAVAFRALRAVEAAEKPDPIKPSR